MWLVPESSIVANPKIHNHKPINLKPTHITAIAPYPIYPAKMGGQKGIASFYEALEKELAVTLVSTQNNGLPESKVGQFLPVLSKSRIRYVNPFLFFKLRRIIKSNQSKVLILEHPYMGWLGAMLKWFCGVKLVVHSHNIESQRFKSTGKWWWSILWNYERWTHRRATHSFFVTDEDRQYAIQQFRLSEKNCSTITYGFSFHQPPTASEKQTARKVLIRQWGIPEDHHILLFNGTLDYPPNLQALRTILDEIAPRLALVRDFNYTILICGKNLPAELDQLKAYKAIHVHYAGFVDDISLYFKGADLFINPVEDGGGIKTKLVEALGNNLPAVSTVNGAIGIPLTVTGSSLLVVHNKDPESFIAAILKQSFLKSDIPDSFFEYFYWDHIGKKAAVTLFCL
jgi:hypothetical protein